MSDEIRTFLREAAGPRDAAPLDVESVVRRSRRRRAGRAAAGVAVVMGIALAAVGVVELPRSGPVEPVVEQPPGPPGVTPPEPTAPEAVAPGEATLHFTFTGADGPDGCVYDGPSRVIAGQHDIDLVDRSQAQQGAVGIEPLAEGYDFQDFEASLSDSDEGDLAQPGRGEPPYRLDRRTEYEWRPESSTSYGLEGLRIVQGPGIELDEVSMPAGTHAMYCAVQLDEPELYDLWPVGELIVVPGS